MNSGCWIVIPVIVSALSMPVPPVTCSSYRVIRGSAVCQFGCIIVFRFCCWEYTYGLAPVCRSPSTHDGIQVILTICEPSRPAIPWERTRSVILSKIKSFCGTYNLIVNAS
ncbi:hypothetical protein BJY52DRAFT_1276460 [Lactarius psammicola]|nr:hypothetical protein BJY52DRAFT_1276460 [Lactarius psammicola]